ncbi:MAG TPA: hypothetical protein VFC78_05970 [Tepidisphaeraceae bacterium]|nr:hypothetical protein [Tepidisphaeraceae bacterium]
MDSINGDSIPKQEPVTRRCPQCRGSGRVLLLTSDGSCAACGGTGMAGGNAAGPETPVGPVSRKYDERERLVSEEWVTERYHLERRYDAETGRLMDMLQTCLEPASARLTTYTYY